MKRMVTLWLLPNILLLLLTREAISCKPEPPPYKIEPAQPPKPSFYPEIVNAGWPKEWSDWEICRKDCRRLQPSKDQSKKPGYLSEADLRE